MSTYLRSETKVEIHINHVALVDTVLSFYGRLTSSDVAQTKLKTELVRLSKQYRSDHQIKKKLFSKINYENFLTNEIATMAARYKPIAESHNLLGRVRPDDVITNDSLVMTQKLTIFKFSTSVE